MGDLEDKKSPGLVPSWVKSAQEATGTCLSSARTGPRSPMCACVSACACAHACMHVWGVNVAKPSLQHRRVPRPPGSTYLQGPHPRADGWGRYLRSHRGGRSESCPANEAWRDGKGREGQNPALGCKDWEDTPFVDCETPGAPHHSYPSGSHARLPQCLALLGSGYQWVGHLNRG